MTSGFHFGLEAEFMLAHSKSWRPLWYKDVTFATLDKIFENISLEGIPDLKGLDQEPPHKKLMPFIVEGYGIPDDQMNIVDAYPKGIEIRTPVCTSIDQTLLVYEELYSRVKKALSTHEMCPIAISHHPVESKFSGPQNKRRHDFWLWAMEVMTTYGPDINVSFPAEISDRLFANIDDLNAKVNYYSPAMAAISLASPFYQGNPWRPKGQQGLSYRTFKRSIVAPAIELHADENFRIEFKVFEMSRNSLDFKNYFLLVLALFLDDSLKGRSSDQERIYDLGAVARFGIKAEGMQERFSELFEKAPQTLQRFGIDSSSLQHLRSITPAQEMLGLYQTYGNLGEVMREYSTLTTLNGTII